MTNRKHSERSVKSSFDGNEIKVIDPMPLDMKLLSEAHAAALKFCGVWKRAKSKVGQRWVQVNCPSKLSKLSISPF